MSALAKASRVSSARQIIDSVVRVTVAGGTHVLTYECNGHGLQVAEYKDLPSMFADIRMMCRDIGGQTQSVSVNGSCLVARFMHLTLGWYYVYTFEVSTDEKHSGKVNTELVTIAVELSVPAT